jgi:hypothetical protein
VTSILNISPYHLTGTSPLIFTFLENPLQLYFITPLGQTNPQKPFPKNKTAINKVEKSTKIYVIVPLYALSIIITGEK